MLSVLWIWTPSLLARACSNAVFPAMQQSSQSDENRLTLQKAGRKTIQPTDQTAKHGEKQLLLLAGFHCPQDAAQLWGQGDRPHTQGWWCPHRAHVSWQSGF